MGRLQSLFNILKMAKIKITGHEDCAGLGKASGKAYAIGQLHTLAPLIEPFPEGGICRGG